MALVVLVINDSKNAIPSLNDKVVRASSNDALEAAVNYLNAIASGAVSASVQVTTTTASPTVTASGTGAQQITYNKA